MYVTCTFAVVGLRCRCSAVVEVVVCFPFVVFFIMATFTAAASILTPRLRHLSPELMRLMIISHLEYAMNFTREPYPLPFAPHHLGVWPIADLPYTKQENMPLEETSWNLLIIALIAQAQGGDLQWIAPYWPVVETWYIEVVVAIPSAPPPLISSESTTSTATHFLSLMHPCQVQFPCHAPAISPDSAEYGRL